MDIYIYITCASVRLEWSLDQLGRHISIVIIIIIIITPPRAEIKEDKQRSWPRGITRGAVHSSNKNGLRGFDPLSYTVVRSQLEEG